MDEYPRGTGGLTALPPHDGSARPEEQIAAPGIPPNIGTMGENRKLGSIDAVRIVDYNGTILRKRSGAQLRV